MMRVLLRRFVPVLLALLFVAPTAQALPTYIFPVTIGTYQWKDLDGKCVSSCPYGMTCPCWPTKIGGFWLDLS
jgi:hypothetical protein